MPSPARGTPFRRTMEARRPPRPGERTAVRDGARSSPSSRADGRPRWHEGPGRPCVPERDEREDGEVGPAGNLHAHPDGDQHVLLDGRRRLPLLQHQRTGERRDAHARLVLARRRGRRVRQLVSARVRRRLLPLGEPADRRVRPGQQARDLEGPRLLEHDHRRPVRRPPVHDHLGRRRWRWRLPDRDGREDGEGGPAGNLHAHSDGDHHVLLRRTPPSTSSSTSADRRAARRSRASGTRPTARSPRPAAGLRSRPAAATASRRACRSPGPARPAGQGPGGSASTPT